jgi:hypothetical protein
MQVDPIKHTLNAPGTTRLKVKCDELVSSFAFKFKLRRYTEAAKMASTVARESKERAQQVEANRQRLARTAAEAGPGHSSPFQLNRSISVYRFPRRALTLRPQLCMGIQPDARSPARSADALPAATLCGHFTEAIYRNGLFVPHSSHHSRCLPEVLRRCSS